MFSRFAALPSFHGPFPLEKVEMFWNLVEKSGDERLQDHPAKAGLEEAHCTIVAPWGWCGVHPTSNLMCWRWGRMMNAFTNLSASPGPSQTEGFARGRRQSNFMDGHPNGAEAPPFLECQSTIQTFQDLPKFRDLESELGLQVRGTLC